MTNALSDCMRVPTLINLNTLYTKIGGLGSEIDPLTNIKNSKVYIYAGSKDTTVFPEVGKYG